MKRFTVALAVLYFVFFWGALAHEADIANNCASTGKAKVWFHEITCEVKP